MKGFGNMLIYPTATSRNEKWQIIERVKRRLLDVYDSEVIAIGVYGSMAQATDGPYSDIEMHVICTEEAQLKDHEFIYGPFKIELSVKTEAAFFHAALTIDDSWALRVGMFLYIYPLYDPNGLFDHVKNLPLQVSDVLIKETMREFMIWEPYETIAKIRNTYQKRNQNYLTFAAKDFMWQTAKLIGLANKQPYTTRAKTFDESVQMMEKPEGYLELLACVNQDRVVLEELYECCEALWTGLNKWYKKLEITYTVDKFPF